MALERKRPKSKGPSPLLTSARGSGGVRRQAAKIPASSERHPQKFAVCVRNEGYPASLELRKLYRLIDDGFARQHALMRVIDESGEDYLYPADYFVRVELPKAVASTLRRIA